jgi:DNA primase
MAFPPSFLDEVRARVSLSGLIGRRVRLTKRGREFTGLCPFHNEKTPSFTVNDDKGFFHCFGCGAHGDAIGFAMRSESLSFPEAVERLAAEAGLDVPRASPEETARFKAQASLRDAAEAACQWFESRLRAPEGRAALAYLRARGLDDETIQRFRLGYAPESTEALKRAIAARNVAEAQLLEVGLLKRPDDGRPPFAFFRDRIMFPIADRRGQVIAFGARALGDAQPKYLNSPDTPLFDKGRTLYALSLARTPAAEKGELVVCEGYMDVIALHQAGFATAVAPLGTALTESQLDALWKIVAEPILCFDADAAGQRAARRAAQRALPLVGPGRSVRFATLDAGKDPDELIRAKGSQAMRAVLGQARPLVDFLWNVETAGPRPRTPEQWAALERALEQRAALIEHRETRNIYRDQLLSRYRRWLRQIDREAWQKLRQKAATPAAGRAGRRFVAPEPGEHLRSDFGASSRLTPLDAVAQRWRYLLATLINHPLLIDELGERLAALPTPNETLDNLVREIHIARSFELDSTGLQRHLNERGFVDAMSGVLADEVYAMARAAGPSAALEDARALCLDALDHLEREAIDDEIEALKARAEADPSEQNLLLLLNARKLRLDMAARAAAIDEDGATGAVR